MSNMALGIIGNCSVSALVDDRARIEAGNVDMLDRALQQLGLLLPVNLVFVRMGSDVVAHLGLQLNVRGRSAYSRTTFDASSCSARTP